MKDGKASGIFTRLAMYALSESDAEAAIFAIEKAQALDDDPGVAYIKALILATFGDLEEAEALQIAAAEAGTSSPLGCSNWIALGERKAEAGLDDEARRCFRNALEHEPGSAEAAVGAARSSLALGDADEARTFLVDAAEAMQGGGRPDRGLALLRIGEGLLAAAGADAKALLPLMSELDAATKTVEFLETSFERLDLDDEADARAWYALGGDLGEAGAFDRAARAYRRATRLSPRHAQAWVNLGITHQEQGDLAKAREAWEHALALDPRIPEVHHNLGMLAIHDDDDAATAEACFRRAVQESPEFAPAWIELGGVLLGNGRDEEALEVLRHAVRHDPKASAAWLLLGVALVNLEDLAAARRAVERALLIQPDYAQAHNNLGVILDALDDEEGAVAAWRRALEIDPYLEEARRNLDEAE
jgi:Flp pilus assembly protein TadD